MFIIILIALMMSAGIIFLLSNKSFELKSKYPSTTCLSETKNALDISDGLNIWYVDAKKEHDY